MTGLHSEAAPFSPCRSTSSAATLIFARWLKDEAIQQ